MVNVSDKSARDGFVAESSVILGGLGGGFQPRIRLTDMAGGSEGREFSFLTAWCIKLFLSLVVRQRRLLYLLPEGRRLNRMAVCSV